MSHYLNARQCEGLMAAAARAEARGLAFNRHWTVLVERAGIDPGEGQRFVAHLLRLASAFARRRGGELVAVYVREHGDWNGEHVHILLHLPPGLSLRNRTRRWVRCAGGTYRKGVSHVRTIGGNLAKLDSASAHYRRNAEVVRDYLLKGADPTTGERLGLCRYGRGGRIIGKRAGWTQNVGQGSD